MIINVIFDDEMYVPFNGKIFGIISYLPDDEAARQMRQERLERLLAQLEQLWPSIPVMIIAQNWKDWMPTHRASIVYLFQYPKLGILRARQKLQKLFLQTRLNYLIMLDDDAIIDTTPVAAQQYIDTLNKHPDGFCFIHGNGSSPFTPYADAQLNLCAVSRYILERQPLPDIDVSKSQAFEDRIYSTLLHYKFSTREFVPPANVKCTQFRNKAEPAPSTWARATNLNWRNLHANTLALEQYIAQHNDLPDLDTWIWA